MSPDDDLERRLRHALSAPRVDDRVDTEDFLSRVHHGAKVRRVRRGVSVGAAAVVLVAGGGLVINATGVLNGSRAPVAGGLHTNTPGIKPPTSGTPTPSRTSSSKTSPGDTTPPPLTDVPLSPNGPIAQNEIQPVSLSATGTGHQWVLAKTPGRDCGAAPACATVFKTSTHGGTSNGGTSSSASAWTDLGHFSAPPASSDDPTEDSVSQIRVTKRTDGSDIYDEWAFGLGLWSSHDSGKTWSQNTTLGKVTALESWGSYVYAGVSSPVLGDDTAQLYRSPTTSDDWQPVQVGTGPGLTSVQALAAANGISGLIDSGNLHPRLFVSIGNDAPWVAEQACPSGYYPNALSTSSDVPTQVGSLWVTCLGTDRTVIEYTDTDNPGTWTRVKGTFGAGVMVASNTPVSGYVAGTGITGIESVSATADPVPAFTTDVGSPIFFGFTNDRYGYLINSAGQIWSTTTGDAGDGWAPYAVSATP